MIQGGDDYGRGLSPLGGGQFVEVSRPRAWLPPLNACAPISNKPGSPSQRSARTAPSILPLWINYSSFANLSRELDKETHNPLLASRLVSSPRRTDGNDNRGNYLPLLAIRPYPAQYVTHCKLRNGTPVTLRPIRPEDEPLMIEFHRTLSEQSVRFRYFGLLRLDARIAHQRLTRICFNDYDREIALVVDYQNPRTGRHEILGVGRLSKLHGLDEAEWAIIISDQWQGNGLGTRLLRLLVEIGRKEKLSRLIAHILPDNTLMQHISKKAGFQLHFDTAAGEWRAELGLP